MNVIRFSMFIILFISCNFSPETYKEGKLVYENYCSGCHGIQMDGLKDLYPPLKDVNWYEQNRNQMPCWLKNGITLKNLRLGKQEMPPHTELSSIQICNVLNYLNSINWKLKSPFTLEEINLNLKNCSNQK